VLRCGVLCYAAPAQEMSVENDISAYMGWQCARGYGIICFKYEAE